MPALLPILLLGALFFFVLNDSPLKPQHSNDEPVLPSPPQIVDLTNDTPELIRDAPNSVQIAPSNSVETAPPRALPVSNKSTRKTSKPTSYSRKDYPFVGKSFRLKGKRSRHNIQFRSNGSVTQDFHSSPLRWQPSYSYGATLTDRDGWTMDVVFDEQYQRITARHRGSNLVLNGKATR